MYIYGLANMKGDWNDFKEHQSALYSFCKCGRMKSQKSISLNRSLGSTTTTTAFTHATYSTFRDLSMLLPLEMRFSETNVCNLHINDVSN